MPSRQLSFPVFDADNHFYEPKEALTQFLPDHRKGVIDYIEVRGRTKIMVRNQVSDYIPTPPSRWSPSQARRRITSGMAVAAKATARSWASR
jgi:hypothetical protein